jgi:DNA-binding response OmpR family regulator
MARILVAEDDRSVGEIVVRTLALSGHEVMLVEDGGAAIDALSREPFDLLITDIVMPVMDGIALALAASAEHPQLRILMMTGYAAEKQRAHNLEALIHDVISKPFTIDQLRTAVAAALE